MKIYLLPIIFAATTLTSQGQSLTDAEREAILKKIQTIQEKANSAVDNKFRGAMSAFNGAAGNENSAMELYLKCEELMNFDKKNKKAVDFRDWKKNNNDKFTEPGFRLALQYQLRWLVLSLQAASKNADRDKLAMEASKIIENMVADAEKLAPYQSILNQNVLSSIFAQAYEISGIEIKNWPTAPGALDKVYEELILPPVRRPDRITHLTTFWQKRISQESELVLKWKSSGKGKAGDSSLEYEKFNTETLPQLRWSAEMDLYKAGDQQGAANRMLTLIEANLDHKAASKWIESLSSLLAPKTTSASETKPEPSEAK